MSTIRLSSGITPNYLGRATRFIESIKKHLNVPALIFAFDFPDDTKDVLGVPCVAAPYSRCSLNLPKFMAQNGAFVDFVPADWKEDDVVIFTDADAYFQRPFTDDELVAFAAVKPGQFLGSYNMPNEPQSLLSEAGDLFPKKPMAEIEREFPGMAGMATVNWGFIVARLDSWRELHKRTVALWPTVDACFGNPARVQLACIYAASQPALEIGKLPPLTHHHAHRGLKEGLSKNSDGDWVFMGEKICFAHAL